MSPAKEPKIKHFNPWEPIPKPRLSASKLITLEEPAPRNPAPF